MIPTSLSGVDQVRRVVLGRIQDGKWPAGTQLPSVRSLARELRVSRGSVERAYELLQRARILRSVPRRGVFVADNAAGLGTEDLRNEARRSLDRAVWMARLGGAREEEVLALVRAAVRRAYTLPSVQIGFVECNPLDARRVAGDLEVHLGVPVVPILLDALAADSARVQHAHDIIATSFNHLSEVQAQLPETDVVGVQLLPTTDSLLALAQLLPRTRVGVICHYASTVNLFVGVISAYPVAIIGTALADDVEAIHALFAQADVLVDTAFAHSRIVSMNPPLPVITLDLLIAAQSLEYLRAVLRERGYPVPVVPVSLR